MTAIPYYMKGYEEEFAADPRAAKKKWLADARFGLFLHYGLYSVCEEPEEYKGSMAWSQFDQKIYVSEYEKLKDKFTAENFDADAIAEYAKECGMKYINITTRHHDSFCLWNSRFSDFNSVNSAAGRDLLQELYEACKKREIGIMLYYSHGRDWRHPHAPNNDEWGGSARPQYDPPEPSYAYGEEHDLNIYLQFMKNQIGELIERFPEAIGIWLDGQAVLINGDTKKFKLDELYQFIHEKSLHMLVSYKQGVLGTEDFFSPEQEIPRAKDSKYSMDYQKGTDRMGKINSHPEKLIEVNATMVYDPIDWAYTKRGKHLTEEELFQRIQDAFAHSANFVINPLVMPDGHILPEDADVIRRVGKRLKEWNIGLFSPLTHNMTGKEN